MVTGNRSKPVRAKTEPLIDAQEATHIVKSRVSWQEPHCRIVQGSLEGGKIGDHVKESGLTQSVATGIKCKFALVNMERLRNAQISINKG